MAININYMDLRLSLAEKTVEELEELLSIDFSEQEDNAPNMDFIEIILELIEEIESSSEERHVQTEIAWIEFQEYYRLRKREEVLELKVS